MATAASMSNYESITRAMGEILRTLRLGKHLSQREFAALAGISQSMVSEIEKGNRKDVLLFAKAARALGLRFSEFVLAAERLEAAPHQLHQAIAAINTAGDLLGDVEGLVQATL